MTLLARAAGLCWDDTVTPRSLPLAGGWHPDCGVVDPATFARDPDRPLILLVFYRAYLAAQD
ncbi:hypothetical protein ABI017_14915, partial [Enterococcus faecium]|uniref:hypothetical protein n=1 Tax=Enterococcus faecium TaxID=1352 RepID=UPI003F42C54C